MRKHFSTIFLLIILLTGLSLLLYPTVSDCWNALHQTRVIAAYTQNVAKLDNARYEALWEAARAYNQALPLREDPYYLTDSQRAEYESLLDVSGLGIMGSLEIPKIGVSLPIYHGTDASVLQIAVGHLEWSSLPVGGEGSHCVLSGHRGLPSARLFTDLDQLQEGDAFLLRVLNETLTYEIDRIRVVEPQEVSALRVVEGQDYCTLVTCTPYGVNTHRLLVRGHRVDNAERPQTLRVTADAVQIEPLLAAPIMAIPMLLILLLILLLPRRRRGRKQR